MKKSTLIAVGIVLAIIGGVFLALDGVDYTKEETVLDIGPIEASAQTRQRQSLPDWVGGVVLASGLALVVVGSAKKGSQS